MSLFSEEHAIVFSLEHESFLHYTLITLFWTTSDFINTHLLLGGYFCPMQCYCISRTIRRTLIFSLDILEKNNDECILILVIYWKKTGLVYTKISNHNIIYSS